MLLFVVGLKYCLAKLIVIPRHRATSPGDLEANSFPGHYFEVYGGI